MALSRKYAALPDLDSAPDTYETPSLTDDNGTAPGTTERSGSASSNYSDSDFGTAASGQSPPGSPQISRSKLHPDAARALFEPARIDATGVDFSERVGGKKRSYRTSSRRVRREYGEGSDGEEETLERRVARLRREIEEVKELVKREKDAETQVEGGEEAKDLSRMLDELEIDDTAPSATAARLQSSLAAPLPPKATTKSQSQPEGGEQATYTVSYSPAYNPTHTLALISSFDSRLNDLESALGLPAISLANTPPPPMLPTLDSLAKKLAMLTSLTPAQLDALSRRVRTLTTEAEKLGAARAAARRGQTVSDSTDVTISSEDSGEKAQRQEGEDTNAAQQEQESKINALYGTLGTIERLGPLLPGVLERLRTLRVVHQGAASKHAEIEEALKRQVEMGKEIERWAEGLERVEKAVIEGERVGGENVKAVEGWVRELERRVGKLEV